ncbi:MAG: hypothetical protein ACRDGT_10965, partial [Candidatus Limnocylindria bacterium]
DKPHTNERGLWWLDLPRGRSAIMWDFEFHREGYFIGYRLDLEHNPGSNRNETIALVRLRR